MADLTSDEYALRHEVGAVWVPRDVLTVSGPDTVSFLQGQLSQDIEALPIGDSALSWLLHPQGKVVALVRVTRAEDDVVLVDTDGGFGEVVLERLQRFKLRVKADLDLTDWRCLALRGPRARDVVDGYLVGRSEVVVAADWPGLPGIDLVGPEPRVPDLVPECRLDAYEAVRIEAGVPVMGKELDERTIPQEAGLIDRTVSFTKGCYTGQELVARIDSRGHVNRHLRGVVIETNVVPPVGATVRSGDTDVGHLTSVAESVERAAPVALAYVRREVVPPTGVVVAWDGASVPARVEELPLVG
jgi:folate-binding protein YgfZ